MNCEIEILKRIAKMGDKLPSNPVLWPHSFGIEVLIPQF